MLENRPNLYLTVLKAFSGDALILNYKGDDHKQHTILIDGGMPNTYNKQIKKALSSIEEIDAIFITHIDKDHIGGILKLLDSSYQSKVKQLFFNSGKLINKTDSTEISQSDGISLINFINNSTTLKANHEELTNQRETLDFFGLKMTLLSPSYRALEIFNKNFSLGEVKEEALISDNITEQEDFLDFNTLIKERPFKEKRLEDDPANGASLSFLIEYQDKTLLLLGDAKDQTIIESLQSMGYSPQKRLQVDYLKLAHHGSKYHSSEAFLALVESQHYIISTNGRYGHPNIETLARVLCHKERDRDKKIYFYYNYPKTSYEASKTHLLSPEEEQRYNCEAIYDYGAFEI